jgi:Xaa-Pro dipeptidase
MARLPLSELSARHAALGAAMAEVGLDAVLITQNADLFYFSGTIQSGTLYLPVTGTPLYLVRKDEARARRESALPDIVPLAAMRDIPALLAAHGYPAPRRLGFELDVLPVGFYERYRRVFRDAECVDASPLVRRVRMLKSGWEISQMRAAARQADAIYQLAGEIIREGMTDIELAAELERAARLAGHPGFIRMRSFNGEMLYAHVCSGPDSAVPAYLDTPLGGVGPHPSFGQGAGWRRIQRHEPIIVDNAGWAEGYFVDQTRVLSIGELPPRLARAYDDMRRIQELMRELAIPGMNCGELYERCLGRAHELGYADHFMGPPGAQASFIGHGLGVEIDEWPAIARGAGDFALAVGMAFAFEPKVVFPGQGAIGIENTFHLGSGGLEQLTFSDERLVTLG